MRAIAADDALRWSDSGAVDERVQVTEGAEREIDGGLGISLAGNVSKREAGGRAQLGGESIAGGTIGVGDNDGCAFRDEQLRCGSTEPRCATGYEEDMVRYLHCSEAIERRVSLKRFLLRG
jgi:hypothetical protein